MNRGNMKEKLLGRIGLGVVLFSSFLAFVMPTAADAVCCKCHPSGSSENVCLTATAETCLGLAEKNPKLSGYTCEAVEVGTDQCKSVSAQGGAGICQKGPSDVMAFAPTSESKGGPPVQPIAAPPLNVQIPGLTFSNNIPLQNDSYEIPFLAQYISAIYRYLVGISVIAAAVMVTYGGFRYLVGSSVPSIMAGKEIIRDALIGLFLVLGSFTILSVVNPDTIVPKPIKITRIRPDPFSYMAGNADAPQTLTDLGMKPRENRVPASDVSDSGQTGEAKVFGDELVPPPSTAKTPTNLTIPLNCPGRDSSYDKPAAASYKQASEEDKAKFVLLGGKPIYPKSHLAIPLSEETIKKYLKEQAETGVPAGAIIAQMLTESWNTCVIENLFDNPKKCSTDPSVQNLNFGGIGCSARDVPAGVCPNVAFFPGFDVNNKSSLFGEGGCDAENGPNTNFNRYLGACTEACRNYTRNTYNVCGEKCYAQKSHASFNVGGAEVWYPSVQCSRKYTTAKEFLNSHLGFVRFCMPYSDSVYKFAYCIGASTYAGATGSKGPLLAEIIERNCLCGSKDSTGCKRDLEFEKNLQNGMIKKRNLFLFANKCLEYNRAGKCTKYEKGGEPDYSRIVKELSESTKGALTPHEFPQNDILPPGVTTQ